MHRIAIVLCLLLAACGSPDASLRATTQPNPTNAPATPGPSPTPPAAYPAPYPAPRALATPNPRLQARWDSATSATVQWTQSGRACLSMQHATGQSVFVGCYDKQGTITLTFGHAGPLDGSYRPQSGDVYVLQVDGQAWRAPLIGRAQYLAVLRR
jgi:hypothetical protein